MWLLFFEKMDIFGGKFEQFVNNLKNHLNFYVNQVMLKNGLGKYIGQMYWKGEYREEEVAYFISGVSGRRIGV